MDDEPCLDHQLCRDGSCQDACRYTECGANTECRARNHRGRCQCLPGFSGRPEKGCKPRKSTSSSMMMCLENSGENKATKKEIAFAFVALAFGSVIFFSGLEAAFLSGTYESAHINEQ